MLPLLLQEFGAKGRVEAVVAPSGVGLGAESLKDYGLRIEARDKG